MIYDVVVVGGGPAGISAAVCAARQGAKVCLVEQSAMLGGLGTLGLVTVIIGPEKYCGGFAKEIVDTVIERGIAGPETIPGDYTWVPFKGEAMKLLYDEKVTSEENIDLNLYTKLCGADVENGCIKSISVADMSGTRKIEGKVFIDATGDAMLSLYCGEEYELGSENGELQAPSMMAYYGNIDYEKYYDYFCEDDYSNIKKMHRLLEKAVDNGDLPVLDLHHPGAIRVDKDMAIVNVGHLYGMPLETADDFTKAVVKGRKVAAEYFEFYKKYVPGFENATYNNTGSVLGIRETRRVKGKYVVTYEDKCNNTKFQDGLVRFKGGESCDLHASSADRKAYEAYFEIYNGLDKGYRDYALLPYRSFLGAKTDNLMVAGRCASTDRKVNAQNRVMGYCMMMGQAVGTAAAIATKDDLKLADIDIKKLQHTLKESGLENL